MGEEHSQVVYGGRWLGDWPQCGPVDVIGENVFPSVPCAADTWSGRDWSQLTVISLFRFWTSCALSVFATGWQSAPISISSVTISCLEGTCYCRHASWTTSAGPCRSTGSPKDWWPTQGIHLLALWLRHLVASSCYLVLKINFLIAVDRNVFYPSDGIISKDDLREIGIYPRPMLYHWVTTASWEQANSHRGNSWTEFYFIVWT